MKPDPNNARRERQHTEEVFQALFSISNAVNTTLDLDDLYQSLHQILSRIIDVTNFFIAIVDSQKKTLYFPYHVDTADDDFDPITDFNADGSLTGKVVQLRKPVLMGQRELEVRASENGVWGPVPLNWMGVPLIVRDTVIGVMAVQSYTDPDRFSTRDLQVLAAVSDQTAIAIDRKRSDDELRKSERRFRQLFEQSNDAVIIHRKGMITDANAKACDMLGYSRDQLFRMHIADLENQKDHTTVRDRIARVLSGKSVCLESEWRTADGDIVPIEISARVADKKRGVIQVMARDISERKRREEEKLKIEKLESIGMLSGGIAHDFNNLLSVILGNISLAQNDIGPGYNAWSFLQAAEKACLRSKDLTRQLITFARGGAPVKRSCAIAQLIENTAGEIAGAAMAGGGPEVATNLWPVACDPEQIGHALGNIIKNAIEATQDGSGVKIKAVNYLSADARDSQDENPESDKYVRITVSDQGTGIPIENRLKVFDPYFSTKQRGETKGMGLGLTTANSIIEKHDGYIQLESQSGQGTTLHIYLPAASPKRVPAPDLEAPAAPAPAASAGQSILMMDDEKMILELGRIMLDRLGYQAEFASDGDQALALFKAALSAGKPYDAVILDLTIKHGISGIQTLKKMQGLAPDIRAIVSSGYSDDPVMTKPQSHGFQTALPKPYKSVELKNVLAQVLGTANS